MKKQIAKYKAYFPPDQSVAIFFLDSSSKQVKCSTSQVAKKKEQFSPRSASVVEWVLGNISILILQMKKSRQEWNFSYSKNHCVFLPCYAVNTLAIALINRKMKTTEK